SRLSSHPAVRRAVVIKREEAGEGQLVAYIVAHIGAHIGADEQGALDVQELQSYLRDQLPPYMVPEAFVVLDSLPLTPNGKLDRRALPSPADSRSADCPGLGTALTPVQEILAGIWSSVLKVDQVGIHDNFFSLGGHSLRATQAMSRIREAFQIEVPLQTL